MDEATYSGNDDIFIGHFVLVKYDSTPDGVNENSIISGYTNDEVSLLSSIQEILTQVENRKNGTRTEPVEQVDFVFYQNLNNNGSAYLYRNFGDFPIYNHNKQHWQDYYYYSKNRYMTLSNENDYNKDLTYYGIFTTTDQQELDDSCYYLARVINLPGYAEGTTYYVPYGSFDSSNWDRISDVVYKIDASRNSSYVSNGQFLRYKDSNNNLTDYYFECVGQQSVQSDVAIWHLVIDEDLSAATDSNFKYKYLKNYKIDKERYQTDPSFRSYDSTIWQKTYANGLGRYVLVASLNAQIPSFNIVADPPNTDVSTPYFANDNSDMVYNLHMPSLYGFRIKEAQENELSDQRILSKLDDQTSEEINAKIYYNLGERNHRISSFKDYSENRLDITPGSSGASYVDSYGVTHENINDYLELSLNFPVIGNVIDDGYDLYYGNNVGSEDKRALDTKYYFMNDVLDEDGNIEEEDKRFLGDSDLNGKSNDLDTLAGTLNTAHNVLGQIVYKLDKNINNYTQEEIEELKNDYIYEYQNKYYRKGYKYNVDDILDDSYYTYIPINNEVMEAVYVNNGEILNYKDFFVYDSNSNSYVQNLTEEYSSSTTYYFREIEKYVYEEVSLSPISPNGQYYTKDLDGNYLFHEILNPLVDEGKDFYILNGIENPEIPLNSSDLKTLQNLYIGKGYTYYPDLTSEERGMFIQASIEDIRNYNNGNLDPRFSIYERSSNHRIINNISYPNISYSFDNNSRSGLDDFVEDLYNLYQSWAWGKFGAFIETINEIPSLSNIHQKIYIFYRGNYYHWRYFLQERSTEFYNILRLIQNVDFNSNSFNPNYPQLVLLNTPFSEINSEDNLKLYVPGYYWTKNNNDFIKYTESSYDGSELYLIDGQLFKDAFYVPNLYYTQVNDSVYNLETGEYDENKDYYKRKNFVVLSDTEGRFTRGNLWPANAIMVPPGVSLGVISAIPSFIEMDLFNGEDSLFGMALKVNKLYGLRDNLERNPYTLMGIINKGKDLLSQFDTLEAGKVLGLNNYGQIVSGDLDFNALQQLVIETNNGEGSATLSQIADAISHLSPPFNWERLKVLIQYLVSTDDNTHYGTIDPQTKDLDQYYGRLIYLLSGDNFNNLLNLLEIGETLLKKLKILATIIDFEPASVLEE